MLAKKRGIEVLSLNKVHFVTGHFVWEPKVNSYKHGSVHLSRSNFLADFLRPVAVLEGKLCPRAHCAWCDDLRAECAKWRVA